MSVRTCVSEAVFVSVRMCVSVRTCMSVVRET